MSIRIRCIRFQSEYIEFLMKHQAFMVWSYFVRDKFHHRFEYDAYTNIDRNTQTTGERYPANSMSLFRIWVVSFSSITVVYIPECTRQESATLYLSCTLKRKARFQLSRMSAEVIDIDKVLIIYLICSSNT